MSAPTPTGNVVVQLLTDMVSNVRDALATLVERYGRLETRMDAIHDDVKAIQSRMDQDQRPSELRYKLVQTYLDSSWGRISVFVLVLSLAGRFGLDVASVLGLLPKIPVLPSVQVQAEAPAEAGAGGGAK